MSSELFWRNTFFAVVTCPRQSPGQIKGLVWGPWEGYRDMWRPGSSSGSGTDHGLRCTFQAQRCSRPPWSLDPEAALRGAAVARQAWASLGMLTLTARPAPLPSGQ